MLNSYIEHSYVRLQFTSLLMKYKMSITVIIFSVTAFYSPMTPPAFSWLPLSLSCLLVYLRALPEYLLLPCLCHWSSSPKAPPVSLLLWFLFLHLHCSSSPKLPHLYLLFWFVLNIPSSFFWGHLFPPTLTSLHFTMMSDRPSWHVLPLWVPSL